MGLTYYMMLFFCHLQVIWIINKRAAKLVSHESFVNAEQNRFFLFLVSPFLSLLSCKGCWTSHWVLQTHTYHMYLSSRPNLPLIYPDINVRKAFLNVPFCFENESQTRFNIKFIQEGETWMAYEAEDYDTEVTFYIYIYIFPFIKPY